MEKEIYKTIKCFEDYKISNLGNVKSFKRKNKPIILKGGITSWGYPYVLLYKEGKRTLRTIHSLVADAFLGESKLEVNHKNGIKTDNNLKNLEYCSRKENIQHAVKIGLKGTFVSNEKEKEILRTFENNNNISKTSRIFNLSFTRTRNILLRNNAYVPFKKGV